MTVQTETFAAGASLFARIAAYRTHMVEAYTKRKVYRTTLSELRGLSTRELDDLGLSPSTIKAVAYEAAYGN